MSRAPLALATDGCELFERAVSAPRVDALARELDTALARPATRASRDRQGAIVGARTLLHTAPELVAAALAATRDLALAALGPAAGIVRVL